MLIGADDDRNSSAVWLTQHKLAEAQCVGKYVPIAPLTFAIFLRSATLDFGEWVCVRVRAPCLLELRQGKLQVEACWSNVGQAVGSKISIWEALHI